MKHPGNLSTRITRSGSRRVDCAPEVRPLTRIGAGLALGALLATLLMASPMATAQEWNDLDEGQQALLAPWSDRWNGLDQGQRDELLGMVERWSTMSPDERATVRRRLEDWNALTPEEQARLRERAERLRQLRPEQRQRIREAQRRLEALSPEQRKALRERWQRMEPDQRRAFLIGMQAERRAQQRTRNPQWRQLLTEDERNGLRTMWESLPRPDRRALMLKMRDLDDQARADLARALLEADPGERSALIRDD